MLIIQPSSEVESKLREIMRLGNWPRGGAFGRAIGRQLYLMRNAGDDGAVRIYAGEQLERTIDILDEWLKPEPVIRIAASQTPEAIKALPRLHAALQEIMTWGKRGTLGIDTAEKALECAVDTELFLMQQQWNGKRIACVWRDKENPIDPLEETGTRGRRADQGKSLPCLGIPLRYPRTISLPKLYFSCYKPARPCHELKLLSWSDE